MGKSACCKSTGRIIRKEVIKAVSQFLIFTFVHHNSKYILIVLLERLHPLEAQVTPATRSAYTELQAGSSSMAFSEQE